MVVSSWLIDKSALVRLGSSPDAAIWADRIQRGLVHVTTITRLAVGCSARSGTDLRDGLRSPPVSELLVEFCTPAIEARAEQVQASLADTGQHRAPSIPDLLIAATAELNELTVLHVDKDFELIAQITGQTTERLSIADAQTAQRHRADPDCCTTW